MIQLRGSRFVLCLVLMSAATALRPVRADERFPQELVQFVPAAQNPVFTAAGPGHWDVRIRERGWILHEGDVYRMWYTGYDGTREGQKMLGYATSPDGITWTRSPQNPIYGEQWVEDMMIVPHEEMYYMFAEGAGDRAQLLVSRDGLTWDRRGTLDIRKTDGTPVDDGAFGTPTAWCENGVWYLFYERGDKAVWLATSRDLQVWKNVQDDPVLVPGPAAYDHDQIAVNQIVKLNGRYYAYYHGAAFDPKLVKWTTNVATSTDLIHWEKFGGNPLFPVAENKSSGILVNDGRQFRLYTMHDAVNVHFPR